MTMNSKDLALFLRGDWRIKRTFDDYHLNQQSLFTGQAKFTTIEVGLAYYEEGIHSIGITSMPAVQKYIYALDETGQAKVTFEDGRPFHTFDLSTTPRNVVHICDKDTYEGSFSLVGSDSWESTWQVTGETKNYFCHSIYTRQHAI